MNIINLYEKYFNNEIKEIFKIFSDYPVYLVGGLVRDMLLNRPSCDIDITVEGNALELAGNLDCEIVSVHNDFGTVKIKINNINIDLASTRIESYPIKGHLPVIKKIGCSLKEDILRRDFTINALAMSLNKKNFGEVIDYTGGIEDLNKKNLKILHNESFIDDTSRILRGLKYSSRLNFSLDKNTKIFQDEYLSNINYDMSYKRISQEFFKIDWNIKTFNELIEQNIYKLINPNINKEFDFWFEPKNPLIYFGLLLPDEKFELTKAQRQIINTVKNFNIEPKTNIEIYKCFNTLNPKSTQILSILKNKSAKKYLQEFKDIKPEITGKDLINLGLKPSKQFNEIFDKLTSYKLNNPNMSKKEELEFVTKFYV